MGFWLCMFSLDLLFEWQIGSAIANPFFAKYDFDIENIFNSVALKDKLSIST